MRFRPALFSLAALSIAASAFQDSEPEALRKHLKDEGLAGHWIYDDIPAGLAAAKKTGKPLLIAFR